MSRSWPRLTWLKNSSTLGRNCWIARGDSLTRLRVRASITPFFTSFRSSVTRAQLQAAQHRAHQHKGGRDGRGPQNGQIRIVLALRRTLRGEANSGARVLRRADDAVRERAEALW